MIAPPCLLGRDTYERVMDGWIDNSHEEALTYTAKLQDPEASVQLSIVARPGPIYAIQSARCEVLHGAVDPAVSEGFGKITGGRMVSGFTRLLAEAVGSGEGAHLVIHGAMEIARLARQVSKLPPELAAHASEGAEACWDLDLAAWPDLVDVCFAYTDAGRALLSQRPVVTRLHTGLYSPPPGKEKVFVRRKVARVERRGDSLLLLHSMHDFIHSFDIRYEIDAPRGEIVRAESSTPQLPYSGICSEPQANIASLVGQPVDAGLLKRIQTLVGGPTGCVQLYDLTADLLRLLALT